MTSTLNKSRKLSVSFGIKIMIIVLLILFLSQSLGTFLSVITFEKIFVATLTSKYEILGKDVKRKIERALKFGKSIEKFVGMDKLVEPLFRLSDELNEIFLSDVSGKILYTSGRAEFIFGKSITDTVNPDGKVLSGKFEAPQTFPADSLFDWNAHDTVIRLHQGRHYIMFPVISKYGGKKAILGLVFNQSVVNKKKKAMFRSARNKLGGMIIISVILIGFLIKFFFLKPAQKQVSRITLEGSVNSDGKEDQGDREEFIKLPQEVEEIQININEYRNQVNHTRVELVKALEMLDEITPSDSAASREIERMRSIITGKE